MPPLLIIIFSSFLITLCAWAGVLFFFLKKDLLEKIMIFLISLSAGALIGGAFLHLLPEAAEQMDVNILFRIFLASFAGFFLIEKLLHWRHCHKTDCTVHTFGYMNLIGDSIHNFVDGLIIASTFMIDLKLGLAATVAVFFHEIPQEIGDFGVLIYSGMKRKNALIVNYLVALTVILGGVVGYFSFSYLNIYLPYLLPVAAGGFAYIAATDLVPEIRKETSLKKSMSAFFIFIAGIMLMYLLK